MFGFARQESGGPRGWLWLFLAAQGWIWMLGAVVVVALTVSSVNSYTDSRLVAERGVPVLAMVARRRFGQGDAREYEMTYRYRFRGSDYEVTQKVDRATFDAGDKSPIGTYFHKTNDPDAIAARAARLQDKAETKRHWALFFGVVTLAGFWWSGRWAARAVLARRHGVRTRARVTAITDCWYISRAPRLGYMTFVTDDGVRGRTPLTLLSRYDWFKIGGEIDVFVRRGHVFWEEDVGARPRRPSSVPTAGTRRRRRRAGFR